MTELGKNYQRMGVRNTGNIRSQILNDLFHMNDFRYSHTIIRVK